MVKNVSLTHARAAKEDEFYTQIGDIKKELQHYIPHFKHKHVFLNCDDPKNSAFWQYFTTNFEQLELKRLSAIYYTENKDSYQWDIYKDWSTIKLSAIFSIMTSTGKSFPVYQTKLTDNGDFRGPSSLAVLSSCDIVVTNPPFSLFRQFIKQLFDYQKDFLIIGNQNALTYKEIFIHLKAKEMWLGVNYGEMAFRVPNYYQSRQRRFWIDEFGQKWRSMGNICWFTTLDFEQRYQMLNLSKSYKAEDYPFYDNYQIINVNKVSEIPYNYPGIMGVPITFLHKFNPKQFDVLGLANPTRYLGQIECYTKINGKKIYHRVLIQKRKN